jgi:UDP-glucose 4-epimerase
LKILVTGGAGFIGARTASQLLEAGHRVTVFDDLSTGAKSAIPPGADFYQGDLRQATDIRNALPGHDAVVHLAAQALVPESVKNPQKAFDINLGGGQNLLEAMRAADINRIVYSSSAAVYGNPTKVPIGEDDPKHPVNPYGATKYAFEQLLRAYHAVYGFNVVTFRYFNPYGPTEQHDPETHAIPSFISATLTGQPVKLYGHGKQARDFVHVDDVARAHVLGLSRTGLDEFNLGSGRVLTVKELVDQIFKIAGVTTDVESLGERTAGEPLQLLADISKARKELGWKPEIGLDEGLKATIEAFRERLATPS